MPSPWLRLVMFSAVVLFLLFGIMRFIAYSEESSPSRKKEEGDKASKKKEEPSKKEAASGDHAEKSRLEAEGTPVASPPFTRGIFPCSNCHEELDPNPTRREFKKRHKDIVLKHDEKNRWCLDCHTSGNMDKLHLASGKLIDFKESYKLCGQCHGPRLRDWKAGEHGKRTGSWSGQKQYLLCVHCHSPHNPKFQPIKPLAPPVRPKDLR